MFRAKIDLTKITEPAWLKEVAQDSCMNLKDVAEIFKVKANTMRGKIDRGEFPKPDFAVISGKTFGKYGSTTQCAHLQWKISTVRNFFKEN